MLPLELWIDIISFLDIASILQLASSTPYFHQLISSDHVQHLLIKRDFHIEGEYSYPFYYTYNNIERLPFTKFYVEEYQRISFHSGTFITDVLFYPPSMDIHINIFYMRGKLLTSGRILQRN